MDSFRGSVRKTRARPRIVLKVNLTRGSALQVRGSRKNPPETPICSCLSLPENLRGSHSHRDWPSRPAFVPGSILCHCHVRLLCSMQSSLRVSCWRDRVLSPDPCLCCSPAEKTPLAISNSHSSFKTLFTCLCLDLGPAALRWVNFPSSLFASLSILRPTRHQYNFRAIPSN